MRYDHFTMLPERAFNKVGGRVTYEGGGSAPSTPSSTQNITTSIPEWAKPYAEKTMGQASALTDMSQNPYQSYSGQKIAGLNPMQQQSYSNIQNMQASPAVGAGMDISANVANQAQQYGQYQPQNFGNQFQGAQFNPMGIQSYGNVQNPNLQNFQMQQPNDVYGARARSAQLNAAPEAGYAGTQAAQLNAAPSFSGMNFQGPQDVNAPQYGGAQLNAAPNVGAAYAQASQFQGPQDISAMQAQAERINAPSLQNLSMQAAGNVGGPNLQNYQMGPASNVASKDFTDPNVASQYMNPYTQNVVDVQQREAQRAADIATTGRNAQAVGAGAFGGSRQAIMDAEAARNLATQKGDIQAQGLNAAYGQAQQAFQQDQARALQAQQANQQAGLTVGQQNLGANLQTQGLGAQYGQQAALANQANQQQANLQNLSAGLQTQGLQAQTGMQAQQANQQTGLQALLANQQTGLQAQQANQQMQYNTGLQNAQLGQQTNLANQQAQQQAALANQSLQGQYGLQQGQFGQQAGLANQQTGLQAGLANQQMQYNTGLQNAQFGQQAGMANQALQGQYGLQQGQFNQAANLANQQANQQSLMANQAQQGQYGLQQGQFNQAANLQNAQMRQQAQLANQQAGLTTGQQNLQAMLGVQQLGAGQSLQAQQANQQAALQAQGQGLQQNLAGNAQNMQNAQLAAQYGLAGQQAGEQSRQFGSNLGLQGLQQQLAAGNQLGNLGQMDYGQNMGINAAQQQAGAQLQSLQQQQMSQNYQDFLNQQRYPYQQLGYMSDILRGVPATASSSSMYQAPASGVNQLASLGLGAYGMNQLFGGAKTSKEGGEIKGYKEGGAIDSYALGGGVGGLGSIPKSSGPSGIEALGLQQQYELALKMPTDQLMAIVNGKPGSIDRSAALTALNLKNKTKVAQEGQQAQQQLSQPKTIKDSVLDQGIPLLEARNMEDIPSGGIAGHPDEDSGAIAHAASGGQVQHFFGGKDVYSQPIDEDENIGIGKQQTVLTPIQQLRKRLNKPTPSFSNFISSEDDKSTPAVVPTVEKLKTDTSQTNKQRLRTNSDTLDGQPFPPPSPGAIASAEQAAQRQTQPAVAPDTSSIAALGQAAPASNKPTFGTDYTALLTQQDAVTKGYSDKMAEALRQFTDSGADKEERNRGRKGIMALMAAKELVKPGQTGMQGLGNVFGQIGELAGKYDAEDRDDKKKYLGAQMTMLGAQAQLAQGNAKSANDLFMHGTREIREYAKLDSEKWYQGEVVKLKAQGMSDDKAHNQALIGAKNRELDITKQYHDQMIGVYTARNSIMGGRNTGQITPALEAKYRSAAIAQVDKLIAGSATERLKVAKDPTYRDTLIDQNIQKILKQGSVADNDFIDDLPKDAKVRS